MCQPTNGACSQQFYEDWTQPQCPSVFAYFFKSMQWASLRSEALTAQMNLTMMLMRERSQTGKEHMKPEKMQTNLE